MGSVVAPTGMAKVIAQEYYVNLIISDPSLPDFWHLETGGCGDGHLWAEAVFFGFSTGTGVTQCSNYWGGSGFGGFTWTPAFDGHASVAQLMGFWARMEASAGPMTAGRSYYAFRATLTTDHATTCTGCTIPACWFFDTLRLDQPVGVGDALVTAAATRNWVMWHGGLSGFGCFVPAHHTTWGQVKSLYR